MLTSVLERLPGMELCTLEQERTGPSYTVDTLVALGKSLPHKRLLFIMGSSDLAILPAWHQWERISELADLLILPRNGATVVNFTQTVYSLWPEAVPTVFSNKAVQAAFTLPTAGKVLFLPQPMLEISSSLVRSRWLSGKKVDFLVPPSIIELLICNEALVESLWQAKLSKEALI